MSIPKLVPVTQFTLTPEDGGQEIVVYFEDGSKRLTAECEGRILQVISEVPLWTSEKATKLFMAGLNCLSDDIREAFLGD